MRLLFALFLLGAGAGCTGRCPPCPCLHPDLEGPRDLAGSADLGPDMACSGVGGFCHAPGQSCCPGLACIGGACAAPAR
jgi:hypothetical protein